MVTVVGKKIQITEHIATLTKEIERLEKTTPTMVDITTIEAISNNIRELITSEFRMTNGITFEGVANILTNHAIYDREVFSNFITACQYLNYLNEVDIRIRNLIHKEHNV